MTLECPPILSLRLNCIEKYTFARGITELKANFGCDVRLSLIVEVIKISGSVITEILLLRTLNRMLSCLVDVM